MKTEAELKELVRQKYGEIAQQSKTENQRSCCGSGGSSTEVYNIMTDDYTDMDGYNADADLGLGCGLPTRFARIKKGDVVIDLGSGAGNDAFVARAETGETGTVIGIDFTPAMVDKATENAAKRGFDNVQFRQGDIEAMPVTADFADVIVSNCVLNLVPNKKAVMQEIFRVLKPGAHFSISDIVLEGELPSAIREAAELYAGCVSGAIEKQVYLDLIGEAGFTNITVQQSKQINIPDDVLERYLPMDDIDRFRASNTGIFSITVYGEKPAAETGKSCCGPTCCN